MNEINVLKSEVYNLIAAGEVVERPSSIVKELIENSIDAGADNITVEIKSGGIEYIKVSDNGIGIERQFLQRAFMAHATSKISSKDDLKAISTLGFRGEALASIAAVSKVKILSRTSSMEYGAEIACEGSNFSEIIEKGSPLGTLIIVEDLFYNMPARAKFLGKPTSEENHITNYITRLILSNPNISLKYIANGKIIYQFDGKGKESAIYTVYGQEALNNSLYISSNNTISDVVLEGFLGKPTFTKPNKTYQTIIINGRYVINDTVSLAVFNAYQERLMKRQYPFYVFYLSIPFEKIDVNVHPNKLDVRFADKNVIFRLIYGTVRRALNQQEFINEVNNNDNTIIQKNNSEIKGIDSIYNNKNLAKTILSDVKQNNNNNNDNILNDDSGRMSAIFNKLADMRESTKINNKCDENISFENIDLKTSILQEEKCFLDLAKPKILGIAFNTYILLEYDNDLYIIDQHAAHERLLYDAFLNEVNNDNIAVQDLLVPYIFNTNYLENNRMNEIIDDINNLGFVITEFGKLSYKISTIPFLLSDINLKDFVGDILNEGFQKNTNAQDYIKIKLAGAACKAAVKAGDALTENEIFALFKQMNDNKTEFLCPHGRPIITKINKKEIEKWFKRVV